MEDRLQRIEDILLKIDKKLDEMDGDLRGLQADTQTAVERLISTFNLHIQINKNPEVVQKVIDSVPGVKADGTPADSGAPPVPESTEVDVQKICKANVQEFFKYKWKDDEEFRKKYRSTSGDDLYKQELGKSSNDGKSPEDLLLLEARQHYKFLSAQQKDEVRGIKQKMIDDINISKSKEKKELTKD